MQVLESSLCVAILLIMITPGSGIHLTQRAAFLIDRECPDSSWFDNRRGWIALSARVKSVIADVVRDDPQFCFKGENW